MTVTIATATIWEDTKVTLLARVTIGTLPEDETPAQVADISTITYGVVDAETGTATVAAGTSVTVDASSIFDTLKTWSVDSTGYNLAIIPPVTAYPTGGRVYRAEATITATSGDVKMAAWEISTIGKLVV